MEDSGPRKKHKIDFLGCLLVFNPTLSYVHLESKIHNSAEGFGNMGLFEEKGVVNVFETTRRNASLEALLPLSVRFNFIS